MTRQLVLTYSGKKKTMLIMMIQQQSSLFGKQFQTNTTEKGREKKGEGGLTELLKSQAAFHGYNTEVCNFIIL